MMNRRMRRALERAAKKTHKLQSQTCVLWVPAMGGYVESFGVNGFRVVEAAALAQQFCDDHASRAALAFQELYGVRAEVRSYHTGAHRRIGRGPIAAQLAEFLS
jgi:hypothetical protein